MNGEFMEFTSPTCTASTLDRFHARRTILTALEAALCQMSGTVLDIGCGMCPYKSVVLNGKVTSYIGLDIPSRQYGLAPDLSWDGSQIPLPACSVDCAIATEVLEHCPNPETVVAEAFRVLKRDGVFFITVPFFWPLHDNPHDEFRYTPFSLERIFRTAGFSDVQITALGGWDAALAQMLGLWVIRRPMSFIQRRILSRLIFPLYIWLLHSDKAPSDFSRSCMMTGFAVIASKH